MLEPPPPPADVTEKELLTQRYADRIAGTLGCWDPVIINGTLTDVCHAGAVEGWLRRDHIRCFDPKEFAEPLRNQVRDHALFVQIEGTASADGQEYRVVVLDLTECKRAEEETRKKPPVAAERQPAPSVASRASPA